ncbi:MAG: flagellar basal body rod protein FlgC, partial [Lachnospiraceae bacterium]|nr:flagellar basal body rod protein FlgC [Lachnospiraceae bacterium]
MGVFSAMNVAGTAMTAQQLRMDIIAENIANASTTRTENGEAYRRKTVVFEEVGTTSFDNIL